MNKDITVVQFQYKERQKIDIIEFMNPQTGQTQIVEKDDIAEEDMDKFQTIASHQGVILKSAKTTRWVYKESFINGDQELDHRDCPCETDFTMQAMTGLRNRNKGEWFGLVEIMKDPQMWNNNWRSQIMYILSKNRKGGLLAEMGAFKDPRRAEDDWASPDTIIHLNEGGLAKVQERGQTPYPEGMDRLMQNADTAIDEVTGVNMELLGLSNKNQPGIVEMTRKQSGITILSKFFDAFRLYRKRDGRVMAFLVREFVDDGRLFRIVGDDKAEGVKLIKNEQTFKFDVIVDDAPTSPNQKQQVFATLTEVLPTLLQAGIPIPPEVIDYFPFPAKLARAWKEQLEQPQEGGGEQDAIKQALQQQQQIEQQKLQLDTQKNQQDFQVKMLDAMTKLRKVVEDGQAKRTELELVAGRDIRDSYLGN